MFFPVVPVVFIPGVPVVLVLFLLWSEPTQANVPTVLSFEVLPTHVWRSVRGRRGGEEGTAALRHAWLGEFVVALDTASLRHPRLGEV